MITIKYTPLANGGRNSGYLNGVCRYIWALSTIGLLTVGTAERAYMCTAFFQISFYKGVFFSECAIGFSDLQISKKNFPKNYPELEI